MAIMTVRGPIPAEALGPTLAHEHLLFDLRGLWDAPPPDRAWLIDAEPTLASRGDLSRDGYDSRPNLVLDDAEVALDELARFAATGGSAVVDLTTVGIGPRPEELRRIAERAGMHVIAGAGFYRARCLGPDTLALSVEEIAERLECAVRDGIAGTSVRAGILGELGTSSPLHPFEERQLVAAARVQRKTGVAINVHPAIWSHEHLVILDVLEAAGADLTRVVLSHCDELVEPAWHARIAERGAVLSFDTFGSEAYFDRELAQEPRDTDRIECLLRLCESGFTSQLVLSQDVCTKLQLHKWGGTGLDHLGRSVLPRLRHRGLGDREIDQMLIATPRRLLDVS
nr:hypothetical protein [uncultured bacterium]